MLVADPAAAAQAEKLAQLKAEEAEMQKKGGERKQKGREEAGARSTGMSLFNCEGCGLPINFPPKLALGVEVHRFSVSSASFRSKLLVPSKNNATTSTFATQVSWHQPSTAVSSRRSRVPPR